LYILMCTWYIVLFALTTGLEDGCDPNIEGVYGQTGVIQAAECLRMVNADFVKVPQDEVDAMGYSDSAHKCVCTTFGDTGIGTDKTNDWLVQTIISWAVTFGFWEPGTLIFKAFLVGVILKRYADTKLGIMVASMVEVMGAFMGGGLDNVGNGAGDIAAAAGAGEIEDDKAAGKKASLALGSKEDLDDLAEAIFSGHSKYSVKPAEEKKKPKFGGKSLLTGKKYQVAVASPDDKEEEKTDDPSPADNSFISFDAEAAPQIHALTPRREAKGPGAGAVDALTGAPAPKPAALQLDELKGSQPDLHIKHGENDPVVSLQGPPTPTPAIQKGGGTAAKGPPISSFGGSSKASPSRGPPANLMAASAAKPAAKGPPSGLMVAKGPPVGLMKKAVGAGAPSSSSAAAPKVKGPSVNLMKSAMAKKQASPEALNKD